MTEANTVADLRESVARSLQQAAAQRNAAHPTTRAAFPGDRIAAAAAICSRHSTPSKRNGSAHRSGSANRNSERDPSRPTSRRRQRQQEEKNFYGLDFSDKEDRILALLERDDGRGGNSNPHAPNILLQFNWHTSLSEMLKPENFESLQAFLSCQRPRADSNAVASNRRSKRRTIAAISSSRRKDTTAVDVSGSVEAQEEAYLERMCVAEDRWYDIDKKTRNALLRSFSMSDYAIKRLFVMEKYIQHFAATGAVFTGFSDTTTASTTASTTTATSAATTTTTAADDDSAVAAAAAELLHVLFDIADETPYLDSRDNLIFPLKDFSYHRLLFHGLCKFHRAQSQSVRTVPGNRTTYDWKICSVSQPRKTSALAEDFASISLLQFLKFQYEELHLQKNNNHMYKKENDSNSVNVNSSSRRGRSRSMQKGKEDRSIRLPEFRAAAATVLKTEDISVHLIDNKTAAADDDKAVEVVESGYVML